MNANLAHRKSKVGSRVQRTDSFSKERRFRKFPHRVNLCSLIVAGVAVCGLFQIALHWSESSPLSRHLSVQIPTQEDHSNYGFKISLVAQVAEQIILNFFHGDERSLKNGAIPQRSNNLLEKRLARKIALCQQQHNSGDKEEEDCELRVVFIGSAQTAGRDNFYNETFSFKTERRLRPLVEAAGLKLKLLNHAQDNDLGREGPQKTHMCVANLVGEAVDVIAWDLDDTMGTNPSAQFEAFVRWASASNPAMILINRARAGGPHGLSRRGKKLQVVEVGEGHMAEVFDEDLDNLPEQRHESYIGSETYNKTWGEGRNSFWSQITKTYSPFVDFVEIDPVGSIWHLDHLKEFSNSAFDAGKVVPLLDCGYPGHAPPCNQIPKDFAQKMAEGNVSLASFPEEAVKGGAVCSQLFGCRHIWYGGTRSHELRGELNALPIVRAFRAAAGVLSSNAGLQELMAENDEKQSKQRALSFMSLPPPVFCSAVFCNRIPTCITSFLPNLGLDLGGVIREHLKEGDQSMPRMGISHFGDDPEWGVQNIEKRVRPLGYIDRKYAYRLSMGDGTKRLRQAAYRLDGTQPNQIVYEPEDAASASIAFTSNGAGPVVICEPPCFSDNCAKKRRMPMFIHVTFELDGAELETPKLQPIEVTGTFCKVIANDVPQGNHVLQIKTLTKYPYHVLFSHVIAFS